MRALFFVLVGIALTLGTIHYMGPERFMKLYQGVISTGSEIAGGGGVDTITKKLNADSEPDTGKTGESGSAPMESPSQP